VTAPEGSIDVLDRRFPVRLSMPASCFWEMAHLRPDRAALPALAARARADEAQHQERFIAPQPRWVPERAHEETAEDMGLPPGWYRDTFPREGMPQPDGTGTFILGYSQAEADEREAAQRRPWQRVRGAVRRLGRTPGQPPAAGEL
jgi:hypothetical protein